MVVPSTMEDEEGHVARVSTSKVCITPMPAQAVSLPFGAGYSYSHTSIVTRRGFVSLRPATTLCRSLN